MIIPLEGGVAVAFDNRVYYIVYDGVVVRGGYCKGAIILVDVIDFRNALIDSFVVCSLNALILRVFYRFSKIALID